MSNDTQLSKATFAGGCFWCMEPPFEKAEGVIEVTPGYTGGLERAPTYDEVSSGTTGHVEAIQVTYDSRKITYDTLLEIFWHQIDPTDDGGQFVDRGKQYRTAIFYHTQEQQRAAEKSRDTLDRSKRLARPIATKIAAAGPFYSAESYHQDYYKKNPADYHRYRASSGRDVGLEKIWSSATTGSHKWVYAKPSDDELKKRLTPLQYQVTQRAGTEPPFDNAYWNNKRPGIYVDVVTGEPLFSSRDKFDSGTGWPSFSKPSFAERIDERSDRSAGMARTEVRSKRSGTHLGHLFNDGPPPTGQRYCINSASLRFIAKEDLEREGYGELESAL